MIAASGEETRALYVYRVDLPQESTPEEVAIKAYRLHGKRKRSAQVPDYLADTYTTYWSSCMKNERSIMGS